MFMAFKMVEPTISPTSISAQRQFYKWLYQGQSLTIAYEILGQGSPVLLLPAFSTVSSRTELAGIAQILSPHFQVIALDWLGFGESDRPPNPIRPLALPAVTRGLCT